MAKWVRDVSASPKSTQKYMYNISKSIKMMMIAIKKSETRVLKRLAN